MTGSSSFSGGSAVGVLRLRTWVRLSMTGLKHAADCSMRWSVKRVVAEAGKGGEIKTHFMMRGIAYRMRERARGGVKPATRPFLRSSPMTPPLDGHGPCGDPGQWQRLDK